MVELASLASAHLSFACLHAAHLGAPRCRTRPDWFPRFSRTPLWLASLGALSLALWLMSRVHPLYEAALLVLSAALVSASAFVILAALSPRALWSLTCATALFVLVAVIGVAHG